MQFSVIFIRAFVGGGESYSSAEMQSAYSTPPVDWAVYLKIAEKKKKLTISIKMP